MRSTTPGVARAGCEGEGSRLTGAIEQEVGPGVQRVFDSHVGEATHVECVGDDDAFEAEAIPGQLLEHFPGDAGRNPPVAGDRGEAVVADHQKPGPGLDPGAKGNQFDPVEPLPVVVEDGELVVWIDPSLTLPREMLEGRRHAGPLQPDDESPGVSGDRFRILPEGSDP